MKTNQFSFGRNTLSLVAGAALFIASVVPASAAWNLPVALPAGQRVEFAKSAIGSDSAGNVFSAGYRYYGVGNVQALVSYKNGASGADIVLDYWRPTADQYYYTGLVVDQGLNRLYLTGTRVVGATSTWFVRCVTFNPGVGFTGVLWENFFTPAALGLAGASSYGSSIVFDGADVYVSGCLNNAILGARLVPATGAFSVAWPSVRFGVPAGVRLLDGAAYVCPPVVMPGSITGGIYQSVRMSFISVTPNSVFLAGTLDRIAGTRADFNFLRINKGTGATPWGPLGVTRDNGTNNDFMFGLAAIADYCYATGTSVNGGNNWAYTTALMTNGTNRTGTPLVGVVGSYANDIEAWDNAGTFTFFHGGCTGALGFITRYTSTSTGAVSAPAMTPFGAVVTDEVCDLVLGYGGRTGFVFATGQTWNAGSNSQQIMRIDPSGPVTTTLLPNGYTECYGSGVTFTTNGGGHVFTHGNSLIGAASWKQQSEVAP